MTIPRNLSFLADGTSALSSSANLAFNSSTNILTVGTGVTGGIAGGTF